MNNLQLPGPFVVFQGIPGDGLCNTMLQEDDEEYFDDNWQDDEEDDENDDDDDDDDSLYACQDDNNNNENNTSSNTDSEMEESSNAHHHQSQASTTIHRRPNSNSIRPSPAAPSAPTSINTSTTTRTTFLGQGFSPSFSTATKTTTPATVVGTMRRLSAPTHSATAAVRPTILPPISNDDTAAASATSTTFFDMEASLLATAARIAAAVASPSSSSQQRTSNAAATNNANNDGGDDEDFVVVNDSGHTGTHTRTSRRTASAAAAAASSTTLSQQQQSTTANTTTITADSSSIISQTPQHQESPSQHPQQHQQQPPVVVDNAKKKTIRLWKTASRTRVSHLYREWFMNCKATAPNLATMDIQPWLLKINDDDDNDDSNSNNSSNELAVFDRLPTNTSLLQNYHTNTTRHHHSNVVLPTAKIVGSLAPGMTVVGTAITTFEIVIPNTHYNSTKANKSSNIDCSQQSQAPACLIANNALDAVLLVATRTAGGGGGGTASARLEFCQHETFGDGQQQGSAAVLVPQQGRLQFLHFQSSPDEEEGCARVVLYSIHGYTVLGAGLPSVYAQPDVWYWKVTCPVGAYVREGLDLTTHLKEVLPYGTVCQVQRKTVNAHGLARLSIRAILPLDDDVDDNDDDKQDVADTASAPLAPTNTAATTSSSSSLTRQNSSTANCSGGGGGGERLHRQRAAAARSRHSPCRLVEGWCSQFLNPMSGQGGSVVQPIPFCVPIVYRITLPEGAVVRQEIELTSPQIGHIPCGAVVTVTERAFSEFPTDKCIERLRLAPGTSFCNGIGAGWISVRLNKKSPEDRLIVQYVGLDTNFGPEQAGIFHYQQACAATALAAAVTEHHQQQQLALLDHNARLRQGPSSHQFNHPNQYSTTTPTIHEISSIDENESRSSLSSSGGGGGGGGGNGIILPMTTTTSAATASRDPHQHPPTKKNNDHRRRRRRPDTPDNSCLCCIDKTRNATMVHGDTGHIACCLDCARMLKASGQPCPVCRLPIDLVILHYWA